MEQTEENMQQGTKKRKINNGDLKPRIRRLIELRRMLEKDSDESDSEQPIPVQIPIYPTSEDEESPPRTPPRVPRTQRNAPAPVSAPAPATGMKKKKK